MVDGRAGVAAGSGGRPRRRSISAIAGIIVALFWSLILGICGPDRGAAEVVRERARRVGRERAATRK